MLDFNDSIEKFHHKQTESSALMQRVNKIIYQGENPDKQYDAILHIINLMRPDFVQSIRNKYPDLSSSEIQICVLSYVDFKIQEIATVLDLKPNTVQTKRTVIRKKMGIPKCMDIADFIDQQTL
jgi:DNA-binding NarL/FixJ family response regulator